MRLVAIREKTVPLHSTIRNSVINFTTMTTSAVAVVSDVQRNGRPVIGYGFGSIGRYAQQGILQERIIPRLLQAAPDDLLDEHGTHVDPCKAWAVMMRNEKPGGHGDRAVAVGAVDMALWDLAAKLADQPLYQFLAERYGTGQPDAEVYTYAAGGYYYPDRGIAQLQDEIRGYLDLGYEAVKIKIGGASLDEDRRRIEAVLALLGDGRALAVDANGRFDLRTALAYAEALAPYGLKWYEEPGDPLDYALHAAVAEAGPTPVATGENLFSLSDARNLIRYGGLLPGRDFIQIDPGLAGGVAEYIRILAMLRRYGWSPRRCIPHGGHQLALHVAAGLGLGGNESYPGVFQPFGGFADGTIVEQGRVRIPPDPGIGFERKAALMAVLRDLDDAVA